MYFYLPLCPIVPVCGRLSICLSLSPSAPHPRCSPLPATCLSLHITCPCCMCCHHHKTRPSTPPLCTTSSCLCVAHAGRSRAGAAVTQSSSAHESASARSRSSIACSAPRIAAPCASAVARGHAPSHLLWASPPTFHWCSAAALQTATASLRPRSTLQACARCDKRAGPTGARLGAAAAAAAARRSHHTHCCSRHDDVPYLVACPSALCAHIYLARCRRTMLLGRRCATSKSA